MMEELVRAGENGADFPFGQNRQKTIPSTHRSFLRCLDFLWFLDSQASLAPIPGGRRQAETYSFRFSLQGGQGPGLLGDLTVWLLIDLFRVGQKKTYTFPDPQTV